MLRLCTRIFQSLKICLPNPFSIVSAAPAVTQLPQFHIPIPTMNLHNLSTNTLPDLTTFDPALLNLLLAQLTAQNIAPLPVVAPNLELAQQLLFQLPTPATGLTEICQLH